MYTISQLYIYPIKSLAGISLIAATVTDRGLEYDRRWMLVDESNNFISQRTIPEMALFKVVLEQNGLKVFISEKQADSIIIPYKPVSNKRLQVQIWDDTCPAIPVSDTIDSWFSEKLKFPCRLVYMPDHTQRLVDQRYAYNSEVNSFSDAYPFLMVGESSLQNLNSKLQEKIKMDRFRPNIVFNGGEAHDEDKMDHITIGEIDFYGAKLSARCAVITIDQQKAIKGKEPTKTLATYRKKNNKIYFGQNLVHKGLGIIQIGDPLIIISNKESII